MENSARLLRQRNRVLRADLNDEQLEAAARALCERLCCLSEFRQANRVAAYFAVNGEMGLSPVIDRALEQGKQVYLPSLDQKALRFSPYHRNQSMRMNRFRLPEPDVGEDEMLAPKALDLVLVPLVVFDQAGNRVGMGGGFYDRSFAFRKDSTTRSPILIGVAHELQKVEQLMPESWDVPLDMVVTDYATYTCESL